MKDALHTLRQQPIAASLFPPTGLQEAIERLGFVQADPIRAPARAQDLILRQRVKAYKSGDLDQYYPTLNLEEDFLYAYGFMPTSTWQLVHPRPAGELSAADRRVLELVSSNPHIHPRQKEAFLGRTREINDWGGYSSGTTRTLQSLHYRGLLRVARRENGVKLYELAAHQYEPIDPSERLRQLVLLIANSLSPLYVWPAMATVGNEPNATVRFLAPFDPLVLDRQRFEHFWGWQYRFEAYTPPAKRQLGYYALPMLWQDDVIGWVTVSQSAGNLVVEPGFKKDIPSEDAFFSEFDAEVERLRFFLQK